jgi:hypothetical protein
MSDSFKWVKARASGGSGGNCVEVADDTGTVHIRDTKSRERGMLTVDAATWRRFIADVKTSELTARSWSGHSS